MNNEGAMLMKKIK